MYSRILVPTDGSKLSNSAVAEAASLAALSGAKLVLLHVQLPVDAPRSQLLAPGFARSSWRKTLREAAMKVLQDAAKLASKADVSPKTLVVEDDSPYSAITKAAKKEKCDLIVMASHGRRGMSGLLIGSETQKVLTHCNIPVLVVR